MSKSEYSVHIWTVSQRVQCIGSSCDAISECGLTVPPDLVMADKKGGCIVCARWFEVFALFVWGAVLP